jgi:hypothetical protein
MLFLSAPAPGMVIDPADSDLTGSIPGVVTFSDPRRSTNRKGDNWREAARARFVPTDPDDFDVYSAVYEWCFTHFPRRVWCDEALDVLPVRGYPRGARRYLALGAKRMLGHQACTQRPVEIMRSLVANGEHIFVWSLANPDDVVYVAKYMGVAPAELGALLAQLRPYEFLWFDRRAKTLTVCPPIAPVPSAARGRRGAEIAT